MFYHSFLLPDRFRRTMDSRELRMPASSWPALHGAQTETTSPLVSPGQQAEPCSGHRVCEQQLWCTGGTGPDTEVLSSRERSTATTLHLQRPPGADHAHTEQEGRIR